MQDRIRTCILRVGGTNCDLETRRSLDSFEGVESEVVRVNQFKGDRDLLDYDCLVVPGGFSHGDHIRAGAVFANDIMTTLGDEMIDFAEEGRPILGICNGFQVLIEAGLLPGLEGTSEFPAAALAINESARYECRWVHVKNENRGNCVFTRGLGEKDVLSMPVAHMEGRFILQREREEELLEKLYDNDQVVLRYCNDDGTCADGSYPENPNGAFHDIAGICDPGGRILGLMPHPERAFLGLQLPDWTRRTSTPKYADGRQLFESVVDYLK